MTGFEIGDTIVIIDSSGLNPQWERFEEEEIPMRIERIGHNGYYCRAIDDRLSSRIKLYSDEIKKVSETIDNWKRVIG